MDHSCHNTTIISNAKVLALGTSINQSVEHFRVLVSDFEQLQIESQNYKQQYMSARDKCENKTCIGSEELKKIISTKDHIIQSVASTLTKLIETKNFDIITDAFKILFEEVTPLTPPTDESSPKTRLSTNGNKNDSPKSKDSSKEAEVSITEDVSFKEESVCEIEGTPTGRTSPIIQTRKTTKSNLRDKKKCPNDWPTSESKAARLVCTPTKTPSKSTPKGNGKLRQSRLHLVKMKTSTVVDLTCSPELLAQVTGQLVQPLVKKESLEYDDTILPSPTSEPGSITLLKTSSKSSPSKFKKPKGLSLKIRCENLKRDENIDSTNLSRSVDMEESINILNNNFANRLRDNKKESSMPIVPTVSKDIAIKKEKCSPAKKEINAVNKDKDAVSKDKDAVSKDKDAVSKDKDAISKAKDAVSKNKGTLSKDKDNDAVKKESNEVKKKIEAANMEIPDDDATNASISLHDDNIEEEYNRMLPKSHLLRPLAENINITNTLTCDAESSMSILRAEGKCNAGPMEPIKRKIPELVEPVYKEPTVRKKAEKRNLQGWSCEECMNFYGVLYKDDPVMLAKKINNCSKHRGRHNPERPKTPPNFWNPRWTVPDDTEELNRMNNAN